MFVKPAPDRMVRRPDTLTHLRSEGENVRDDTFWTRRVLDGDVVVAELLEESPGDAAASGEAVEVEPEAAAPLEPESEENRP